MSIRRAVLSLAVLLTSSLALAQGTYTQIDVPGGTFQVLVNFTGANGSYPFGMSLTQGKDGNLYGTTPSGGAQNSGTVFRMSQAGELTTLYSFCSLSSCMDGMGSESALLLARDGYLYGTTTYGGMNGYGSVYKITHTGILSTLYSFDKTNGANPTAGLLQASDGNFYGTTFYGGAYGYGSVFKLTPEGSLTVLHNFDYSDGYGPDAELVEGEGAVFGSTLLGGSSTVCAYGCGTLFKITPTGSFTLLHSFDLPNGIAPHGLVQAAGGSFYGVTEEGGVNNDGTIFKLTAGGALTTLHSFDRTDGFGPASRLIVVNDGNLYGVTAGGGPEDYGTIFSISPSGSLATLYTFDGTSGQTPYPGLTQHTSGTFFGGTWKGGTDDLGTLFSFSEGLGPFIRTVPTSGRPGFAVMILGTSLTSATSVTFNGVPADFGIVSDSLIKATVPAGVTTGYVQVVTSSGTLTSNSVFQVR